MSYDQVDLVLVKMGNIRGSSSPAGKGCDSSWTAKSVMTSRSAHKGCVAVVTKRAARSAKARSTTSQINRPKDCWSPADECVSRIGPDPPDR